MQRIRSIAVTLLLCACSSMDVQSEFAPDANFGDCRTYAWLADEVTSTGNPKVNDTLLHMYILGAVKDELVARGFELVQAGDEPDLFVVYHAAVDRAYSGASLYETSDAPGYSYAVPDTQVTTYQQGSLILDFLDGKQREIVWRGSAQARADLKASPDKRRRRLEKAVRLMLEDFPVQR